VTQNALNGGSACPYVTGYAQTCNTQGCLVPVNCYGYWAACSEPCGGGTQTYVQNPRAANRGQECPFASGASQDCNTDACHGSVDVPNNGLAYFTIPKGVTSLNLDIIGGGGGGGGSGDCDQLIEYHGGVPSVTQIHDCSGGSGCSGGHVTQSVTVTEKTQIAITASIGKGGAGGDAGYFSGQNGEASRVTIGAFTYTAGGGGGGEGAQLAGPADAPKGCSTPPSGGIAGKDGEERNSSFNPPAFAGGDAVGFGTSVFGRSGEGASYNQLGVGGASGARPGNFGNPGSIQITY
jgi:hypothetical protein